MIYLDTHVVAWLYAGLIAKLSDTVKDLLAENAIQISPVVRLELQYLFEIGRLKKESEVIVADLAERIGLVVRETSFIAVVSEATVHSWTRDPFDRLIVAQASLENNLLVSKDQNVRQHYEHAVW